MWKKRFDPGSEARASVEAARAAVGEKLLGATLYGSAAGGEFDPAHSDLNVAFVFSALGAEELEALRSAHARWTRARLARPLLITREGLRSSVDAFPLEYLLIRERHEHLHGEDFFGPLEIERAALRREIERVLRAQELGLAWTYLALASTPSGARHWAGRSGTAIAASLAGLLYLVGERIPSARQELADRCAERFGLGADELRRILVRPSESRERVDVVHRLTSAQAVLSRLIDAAEALDAVSDRREGSAPGHPSAG